MPAQSVVEISIEVADLIASSGRHAALRHAIAAAEPLLRNPTDALRIDMRDKIFQQFAGLGIVYQSSDFESVDYHQYELSADLPMFRGPPVPGPALARGDYFCVMGAAQTFGRLVRRPWPLLLSEALGVPALNLGRGGVGPDFFLDPKLVELARRARFVVLQVMSGRSVGCEDYPGGRLITKDSKVTKVNRWEVIEELWNKDPATALSYVRRWNANYLELYRQLRDAIDRPTLLLWISARKPEGWKPERLLKRLTWGSFPQLIGRKLLDSTAEMFDHRYECVTGATSEQPLSRITGEPCPYFGSGKALHSEFSYYPSSATHAALAEALVPWASDTLRTSAARVA